MSIKALTRRAQKNDGNRIFGVMTIKYSVLGINLLTIPTKDFLPRHNLDDIDLCELFCGLKKTF